jgi:hypothetical protein
MISNRIENWRNRGEKSEKKTRFSSKVSTKTDGIYYRNWKKTRNLGGVKRSI